jgi:MFS family permease
MLSPVGSRAYRHLFAAQVIALLGTGLATVALGLVAFQLAGADAGTVLGTALAIKMVAYVTIAPVAGAFASRLPRRAMLVALDLVRAAVALCLPFVDAAWQVYALIFVLQAASAAFTPTFQATIPDVLPDEAEYTRALSLSQLAYTLENLVSPALAAALLAVINFRWLFAGTALGFLASAALVVSVLLPSPKSEEPRGIYDRTTRGIRLYLATPRLRGLLALDLAIAAAGAMVIVNTVVLVQARLGLGQRETAWALAAFGCGSMLAALALPRLLEQHTRPPGHAGRRGPAGARAAGRTPRAGLRRAAAALARAGYWLLGRGNAHGPTAAALGALRGPAGTVRRAVRPLACLLAAGLPAGGLARRQGRIARQLCRACLHCCDSHPGSSLPLAGGGPRGDATRASQP